MDNTGSMRNGTDGSKVGRSNNTTKPIQALTPYPPTVSTRPRRFRGGSPPWTTPKRSEKRCSTALRCNAHPDQSTVDPAEVSK